MGARVRKNIASSPDYTAYLELPAYSERRIPVSLFCGILSARLEAKRIAMDEGFRPMRLSVYAKTFRIRKLLVVDLCWSNLLPGTGIG